MKGAIMRVVHSVFTTAFTVFTYEGVYTVYTVFTYEGVYTVYTVITYEGVYTVFTYDGICACGICAHYFAHVGFAQMGYAPSCPTLEGWSSRPRLNSSQFSPAIFKPLFSILLQINFSILLQSIFHILFVFGARTGSVVPHSANATIYCTHSNTSI